MEESDDRPNAKRQAVNSLTETRSFLEEKANAMSQIAALIKNLEKTIHMKTIEDNSYTELSFDEIVHIFESRMSHQSNLSK